MRMRRLLPALGLVLTTTASAAQTADTARPAIPYPTVAAALDGLRTKSGVNVVNQSGFTVIEEPAAAAIWTFTSAGHPAHPAVVRRGVVQRGDNIFVEMQVKCEADKTACDK